MSVPHLAEQAHWEKAHHTLCQYREIAPRALRQSRAAHSRPHHTLGRYGTSDSERVGGYLQRDFSEGCALPHQLDRNLAATRMRCQDRTSQTQHTRKEATRSLLSDEGSPAPQSRTNTYLWPWKMRRMSKMHMLLLAVGKSKADERSRAGTT
eukprot:2769162-Rhodomonas_salina.2